MLPYPQGMSRSDGIQSCNYHRPWCPVLLQDKIYPIYVKLHIMPVMASQGLCKDLAGKRGFMRLIPSQTLHNYTLNHHRLCSHSNYHRTKEELEQKEFLTVLADYFEQFEVFREVEKARKEPVENRIPADSLFEELGIK